MPPPPPQLLAEHEYQRNSPSCFSHLDGDASASASLGGDYFVSDFSVFDDLCS
jgi:hypothetical protein